MAQCVCAHVCMCVHVHACACRHTCVHVYVHACVCARACMHVCAHACVCVQARVCVCASVHVHTCVCMCMCMHVRVCVCVCVWRKHTRVCQMHWDLNPIFPAHCLALYRSLTTSVLGGMTGFPQGARLLVRFCCPRGLS